MRQRREPGADPWDEVDRPVRIPPRAGRFPRRDAACEQADENELARSRWLAAHNIQMEFVDAGIGSFWLAQQGDGDPVAAESEEGAIARLGWQGGVPWRSAAPK